MSRLGVLGVEVVERGRPVTEELVSASKRWQPLNELLDGILGRIVDAVPGCVGAALTIRRGQTPPLVLASRGLGTHLASDQLQRFGGPVADAAATGEAVSTEDAFADPRWPELTRQDLASAHPELAAEWAQVRGIVALPSDWNDDGVLVLSVVLDRCAGVEALRVLQRYERLASAALVVSETAAAGDTEQMLQLLASRAAIEEAKGAVIAVRRCGPDEAWAILRRASQETNVKVRELAVALVEHLGNAPAPQPNGTAEIVPTPAARQAARLLWAAISPVQ